MVLSGHEHNFQHSEADGIHYFVTGGGGKVREGRPDKTDDARTVGWASLVHFVLVRIEGNTARVTPIGEDGRPLEVRGPDGTNVAPETTIVVEP
jgi:hypothetical protein